MKDFPVLKDMEFKDKVVLIRTGFDVPIDCEGSISDDSRIRISIPTIEHVLKAGAKQIIIMFHLGRPKDNEEKFKVDRIAQKLGELIGMNIKKLDDHGQSGIPDPKVHKIVMLENLRFNKAEKSKKEEERDIFGEQLSALGDVFVQDAFSNCHHAHASMTSIPKFLPSCAGKSVEKELSMLAYLDNPKKPFVAIIGGLKAEKLNAVANVMKKADKVLIAGALAFTMLKALGYNVGKSKVDDEGLEEFGELVASIKDDPKIVLPIDAGVAKQFLAGEKRRDVLVDEIADDDLALDIGKDSISFFKTILKDAKTITLNGPIGVYEFKEFALGTKEIAEYIASLDAKRIIGGGDSADAIAELGLTDKMTHVSTGGGASLTLLEGKKLVAIEALKKK